MAKTYEVLIDGFSAGMSDDPRLQVPNQGQLIEHFDIYSRPKALVPQRSFISDMNDGSTSTGMKQYKVKDIVYYEEEGWYLAFGTVNGTTGTQIFYKLPAAASWTVTPQTARTFTADFTAATNVGDAPATLGTVGLADGVPVTYTGATAAGLTNNTVYYLQSVSGTFDDFKLFTDASLTTELDITANTTGSAFSFTGSPYVMPYISYIPGSAIVDPGDSNGVVYFLGFSTIDSKIRAYQWSVALGIRVIAGYTSGVMTFDGSVRADSIYAIDGNVYFSLPASHRLVRVVPDVNSPSSAAITGIVPVNLKIRSFFRYGNYLGIAASPEGDSPDKSRLLIWNMADSDVTENVEWGLGQFIAAENIAGTVIGITDRHANGYFGNDAGSITISRWAGGTSSEVVKELPAKAQGTATTLMCKSLQGQQLRFYAKYPTDAAGITFNDGIWSYGRGRAADPDALSLSLDTSQLTDADGVQFFRDFGNFTYVIHSGDGSISRTADTATYAYTSTFISQVYYKDYQHQLAEVELTTEALPASSSIVVSYRINGGDWITVLTADTDNETYFLVTKPATDEFSKYHECEFKIESTGGAVPLRLRARYKVYNSSGQEE